MSDRYDNREISRGELTDFQDPEVVYNGGFRDYNDDPADCSTPVAVFNPPCIEDAPFETHEHASLDMI